MRRQYSFATRGWEPRNAEGRRKTYSVGTLDNGSIGNRVGEGDTELDDIGSTSLQGQHQGDSAVGGGETGSEESDKDTTIVSAFHGRFR
jgi:hypothetical protein